MHQVVANGGVKRRSRLGRALALGVLANAAWLAKRRGRLQHQIAARNRARGHHEHRLRHLPLYAGGLRPHEDGRPTVSVVVPALNEADSIGWVLENIPAWIDEIVLVDGLSIDRTEEVARTLVPNLVVVHQRSRGKGAALRAGFHAARGDIVAMIDADGSTDPRELGRFVDALVDGADFAKGSREMSAGGSVDFTPLRRLGNLVFVGMANVMYGTHFTDLLYGYCAFWREYLDDLELSADGFEIETQLVVNAVKAGLTVAEVPSVELERRAGASNLNAFSDGLRILETMLMEHPQLGQPAPGEVYEMVEIETAAPSEPRWLPAGSDRRHGGDRRGDRRRPDGLAYVGAERRSGDDRRQPVPRTVRVLVPRRGPGRHGAVLTAEARSLAASLGRERSPAPAEAPTGR